MNKILRLFYIFLFCATALFGIAQTVYEVKKYSLTDGLPSNLICCIEQDSRGLLWMGTWRGLCCFDGYEFMSFNNVGDPQERPMCSRFISIKTDKDDNVWCLTYDRRVYLFNPTSRQWTDVSNVLEEKFGEAFRIANIYPLESGVVWLKCFDEAKAAFRIADVSDLAGMTNEFGRMDEPRNFEEKKFWFTKKTRQVDASVPEFSSLKQYYMDSQDNVWSFDNKLVRITPKTTPFIFEDFQTDKATRTIPTLPDMEGKPVYAAITDSKGRRWTGTKGAGLFLNGQKQEIKGKDVYDIFEDSRGRIWVATFDEGINLLHEGKFVNADNRLKGYPKGNHTKVRHIMETRGGVIFLSTADGIVCFSNKFDRPEEIVFHAYSQDRKKAGSLPGGNVMQVLQASDGRIYISTMTGGLVTVKSGNALKDNLAFEPVAKTQDTEGIVVSFIEDGDGCLWLAREDYLEKYDFQRDENMVFDSKDFGREVSFSEALPVISQTYITFGTVGGTLSFNPKQLVKSSFTPPILFSYVQFQGSQERQPILYTKELDVPSDRRNLTIYFSALDYQDNDHIQYAYRIVDEDDIVENLDNINDIEGSAWNYVGRSHCASFNNLPCGHLRLLVRSTNADGVWTNNIAELSIYSHPTFWETPWAWLLYIIIIIGIVLVAVYIVQMRQRHRREREDMERKLETLLAHLESQMPSAINQTQSTTSIDKTYSLPEVKIEDNEKQMMERLISFLDENICNSDLKISDLADSVNMSRSVFYERLKNITGMSPVDFLRYLRIQRAKQMLATSDVPISQIAYDTGFSDPTYFTKVFKKSTDMSPLNYRKSQKEVNISK